jgi:hypothetical protein
MKSDGISFDLEMQVGEDWIGGSKRDRTPVIYPATGAIIAEVPVATDNDARAALEAAARAQPEWARHSPAERAAFLLRIVELVRKIASTSLRPNGGSKPHGSVAVTVFSSVPAISNRSEGESESKTNCNTSEPDLELVIKKHKGKGWNGGEGGIHVSRLTY